MATVDQPTAKPTNKLAAATIASAAMAICGLVVRNFWPAWYDDAVWSAVTPAVVLALGYLVRDEAVPAAAAPQPSPAPSRRLPSWTRSEAHRERR